MFDRMVNQLSAAAASTSSTTGASTTSAQAAAALMKFGGFASEHNADKEEPLREEDGQLGLDAAERMLKWHAEAVGRCVELTPTNDVCVLDLHCCLPCLMAMFRPKHAFALSRVLAEAIGTHYVEVAMET